MSILLDRGERGLLVGQTGSGKTQNAIFQLRNTSLWPVIILDTKIEDHFFGIPDDDETLDLIESIDDFKTYARKPKKEMADYLLVRPAINELLDFDVLDEYCQTLYNKFGACFIYFDELYNWHKNGQATPGMIGLYTRGRSKGKTVLGATQRPSWISRFCLTESSKFYLHNLIDNRDAATLSQVIPGFLNVGKPAKFHFHYYSPGNTDTIEYFQPVPYQELNRRKIFKTRWL